MPSSPMGYLTGIIKMRFVLRMNTIRVRTIIRAGLQIIIVRFFKVG